MPDFSTFDQELLLRKEFYEGQVSRVSEALAKKKDI